MNERFPSVAIVLVLAMCLQNCEAANRPPTQQDSPAKAESTTPKSPQEQAAVTWPPLSRVVLSPYLIDTDQLSRVEAGDSLALPLAGGFQTLTLKAPLKDGVLGIQDLKVQTKDITGRGMSLVVRSLHTHDPKGNQASFVWNELTATPDSGVAMDLVGSFESGSLVG